LRVVHEWAGPPGRNTRMKETVPQAASCDCRPGHTTSSFVLPGEHRHSGGRSHPADGHLAGDSHLEKVKRIIGSRSMVEINDRSPYPCHEEGCMAHDYPTRCLGCGPTRQASQEESNRPGVQDQTMRLNCAGHWVT
jgi:hypothetical protein